MTTDLSRDWDAYLYTWEKLEQEIFKVAESQIQKTVTSLSEQVNLNLDRKRRFESILSQIISESVLTIQNEIDSTTGIIHTFTDEFDHLVTEVNNKLKVTEEKIRKQLAEFDIVNKSQVEIASYQQELQQNLNSDTENITSTLNYINAEIGAINWYSDENGYYVSTADENAALDEELFTLRETAESNLELVQLGSAIAILGHEFSNTIRAIRSGIRRLRNWANRIPQLRPIYQEIYENFNHLDNYLTLFTPLNRRLYRTSTEITGTSIAEYIDKLFSERLNRHNIKLNVTRAFRSITLQGYPSTFYPVFVNLIDNSIFWLKDRSLPREIRLDGRGGAFVISDTGPGIPLRDQNNIFHLGFTRKPGGRGMGLYISSEVLKKAGYQISLDISSSASGTTFIIQPIES